MISTIIQITKITNKIPAKTGAAPDTILYKKAKTVISIAKNPKKVTNLTNKFQINVKKPMIVFLNV